MKAGDCFENRGTDDHRPHCWVIVSDPERNSDEILILNFTSWGDHRVDDSCIIMPDEHPYVRHKTCINYREPLFPSLDGLEIGLSSAMLFPLDPVSDELLARIRQGAIASRFADYRVKNILVDQDLVE